MKTLNLLTASLDEIVFEGRNKAYGAFVLRRIYNRHLITAAFTAFALFLLLVSIPLVVQKLWPDPVVAPVIEILPPPITFIADPTHPKQPVVPSPTAKPIVVTPQASIATRVVKDDQVKNPVKDVQLPLANSTTPGDVTGLGDIPAGTGVGIGTGISDTGHAVAPPPTKPFIYAEVMPEFAGGADALQRYMQRNLRYPSQALSNSISGRVFVAFTVNADGSISDVEVVKGLGYGTEQEAARVVRNMPAWTPGRQNDVAVPVRYTMPITFRYE
ncbi:energy transducer TonB [Hymenobacter jejuensis]|uniref:Energy transducer TonB n=1 Tax=Hymenobacter jejuensis TaxID=2502781 RepID=A0A5B7ZXL2_9BACT|nr:energy transducer TonB [Hymenobacter jejuensis]QDA59730.1 energy transducer TonB [Hymenobacter jejuensis]